ncbi:LacI family DNA-binding transcriptional regulator [Streptacidiphilus monticola]
MAGTPRWYVDPDNRGGGRLAAEHLVGRGRRRIAMITGQPDLQAAVARAQGFREALTLAGLSPAGVEAGHFTQTGGEAAMERLLAEQPDLDAVFAASDGMALGAMRALRRHGRRVPDDVAVVGFDDLAGALYSDPPLTTVHQPVRALGHEMARSLVAAVEGEDPNPLILPTRLVVRESAP